MARQLAVVTGASRGIGRAIALTLAPHYEIVAVARSGDQLGRLADEIQRGGGACRPIAVDLTDHVAVTEALRDLEPEVLVNNAGVGVIKPLLELTPDEWHRMVATNFDALFYVTRAVLPGMIRRGGGHVVTIGSLAGRNTFAGGTGYAGTKHAVIAFTESLMQEVRQQHVRVSVVMPGSVSTTMRANITSFKEGNDTSWMLTAEDVAAAVEYLVRQPANAHVSRIEMRPSRPGAK
ncbi:MAG TPA: SDR family NAD(P)-dependent oxidoreductase [Gemmatimonadaceae bacterium]|nr:SDR family NAD(P)-dependent oxidoreductase [Gemmatimonadaceae bacterium]